MPQTLAPAQDLEGLTLEQLFQRANEVFTGLSTVTHTITLIHRITGDEVSFDVTTRTDSFIEVCRAMNAEKLARNLKGYELYEALCHSAPF